MKLTTVAIALGVVTAAIAGTMQNVQSQEVGSLSAKALFYNASGNLTGVTTDEPKAEPASAPGPQAASGASDSKPKPSPPSQAARPLALRSAVLLVTEGGGTREVKPSYKFKTSDRVKLAFTSSRAGYFYLATVGSSGRVQVLAPRANEPAILQPGYRYTFPVSPTGYFRFDSNVGKEELWAVLSDDPLSAINMGAGQIVEISAPTNQSQPNVVPANKYTSVANLTDELATRDLLFEEDSNALYVSAKPVAYTPTSAAKPSVIVKLTLSHD